MSRIKYKPHVELKASKTGDSIMWITISSAVICANDRVSRTSIGSYTRIDPYANENAVLCQIRALIVKLELHEVDEWLTIDGECLVDPHPEQKKKDKAG